MLKTLHRKSSGQAVVLLLLVVILGLSAIAWVNRQYVYDWARLRNYKPTDQIVQLAFDTTMTNSARRLFYVNHPELDGREQFNNSCSGFGEDTIVLGCYVSNGGIFIFKIDNKKLEGVEQVTAAHEMLHAAYDRLDKNERSKVDSMTSEAFATVNDDRIRSLIESYRQRDATVVPNELHSIMATEVRSLPPGLENYYKKYFTNRHAVVAFSEKYESTFTKQRNQAAALELQISGLRNDIKQLENTLTVERNNLQQSRQLVDTSEEAVVYNSRVASYNSNVSILNSQIHQYNKLVDEYKHIAVEAQELYQAMDSRPKI